MNKTFFITGIGTGVGKTLASAILAEALEADYWKPIQAGFDEGTDANTVRTLVSNPQTDVHPELYRLKLPASPHIAAREEGIRIELEKLARAFHDIRSHNDRILLVEGAGGLLVPLNEQDTMLDLVRTIGAEVILVSRNYLGSINHSLLTARVLQDAGIPVRGWIFSDEFMAYEDEIASWTGLPVLGRIPAATTIDRTFVRAQAEQIRPNMRGR
jgi:dethiobiotin synthetase